MMEANLSHVLPEKRTHKMSKAERRLQRTLDAIKARVDRAIGEWQSYIDDHWREFPRTDVDTLTSIVKEAE